MNYLLVTSAIAVLLVSTAAIADDERPRHYEGAAITSTAQAHDLLNTRTADMDKAVAAKNWDEVHKISYDLEAALDYLEDQLEAVEEHLEEVHEASEEYEEKKIVDHFEAYKTALTKLK